MKKILPIAAIATLLILCGCGAAFGPAGGVPANAFNFICGSAPGVLNSEPATSSMPLPNGSTLGRPSGTPSSTPASTTGPAPASLTN